MQSATVFGIAVLFRDYHDSQVLLNAVWDALEGALLCQVSVQLPLLGYYEYPYLVSDLLLVCYPCYDF